MPVIDNRKTGKPLPPNAPLAQPRIWFGMKRPMPSGPATPNDQKKPDPLTPSADGEKLGASETSPAERLTKPNGPQEAR